MLFVVIEMKTYKKKDFPLAKIRLGLPATNWFPLESESGRGLQELREMGASGVIQPVRVVVQLPEGESALSARRAQCRGSRHREPAGRQGRRVAVLHAVGPHRPG